MRLASQLLSSCCDCGLRHQQLSRQCALRAAVLNCVVHIQVPWSLGVHGRAPA